MSGARSAIQQRIARFNETALEPLWVRSGVSIGDVDVADGDYFGVAVVEAARLCARAASQQILVSDSIRALARHREEYGYELIGDLTLKGFDAPVTAYSVSWNAPPSERAAWPLPARVEAAAANTFVGRRPEYEHLNTAFKAAAGGTRRVVLLSGEPGIGKTSLAVCFAAGLGDDAVVLYGRSDEDLGIPYQPWVEALGHLVRHSPDDLIAAHVAARTGELARLVPDLSTRAPWLRPRLIVSTSGTCCTTRPSISSAGPRRYCRSCLCSTTCTGPIAPQCNSCVT